MEAGAQQRPTGQAIRSSRTSSTTSSVIQKQAPPTPPLPWWRQTWDRGRDLWSNTPSPLPPVCTAPRPTSPQSPGPTTAQSPSTGWTGCKISPQWHSARSTTRPVSAGRFWCSPRGTVGWITSSSRSSSPLRVTASSWQYFLRQHFVIDRVSSSLLTPLLAAEVYWLGMYKKTCF